MCASPSEEPPKQETVTIPRAEYEDLLQSSEWLACLENAGVDNWGGISFAHELAEEEGLEL